MSKIAEYLNKHMVGEVTADPVIRARYATDASIFSIKPDIVAYPRVTNDIRKAMRFAWQLATKGHVLPIIPRGSGTDKTGGAIGKGLIIATSTHMNQVFEYDPKQKLVRLQPGATVGALKSALGVHGASIPRFEYEPAGASVGGVLARSRHALKSVHKLEIVLASGDVMQTGMLKGRALAKKKKLQTFEGDVYREIDALIDDNKDLIDGKLGVDMGLDHAGYAGIAEVKTKKGFDLTPLFLGSQGTLGIISEMILKAEYVNQKTSVVVAAFNKAVDAHDAIDATEKCQPGDLDFIEAEYFQRAKALGKEFPFYEDAAKDGPVAAVVVATVTDFSERVRKRKVKRLVKAFEQLGGVVDFVQDSASSDLTGVRDVVSYSLMHSSDATLPLIDGVFVPLDRFEDFTNAVAKLAHDNHVKLPIFGRPFDELWYTRPVMKLETASDKQKMIRLVHDYEKIVLSHNGLLFGDSGEGRLLNIVSTSVDSELNDMYTQIRDIFDPHKFLNTGVKQRNKTAPTGRLHSEPTPGQLTRFGL